MLATASAVVGSSCLAAMAETRTFGVICRLFSSSPTARSEPRWLGSTVEWYWVNRITLERREVVVNCEAELKWQSGERGTRSCNSPIVPCSSILPAHVMFIFFLLYWLLSEMRVFACVPKSIGENQPRLHCRCIVPYAIRPGLGQPSAAGSPTHPTRVPTCASQCIMTLLARVCNPLQVSGCSPPCRGTLPLVCSFEFLHGYTVVAHAKVLFGGSWDKVPL